MTSFLDMNEAERGAALEQYARQAEESARQAEEKRRSLPCYVQSTAGKRAEAVDACERAEAHRSCDLNRPRDFRDNGWCCPRQAEIRDYRAAEDHLKKAGISARERKLLLASLPGHLDAAGNRVPPVPLLETDGQRLMRALASGESATVSLAGGRQVPFTGDEIVVVIAGPPGVGKTVSAASLGLLRARHGFCYVRAPALTQLDADIDRLKRVAWLVIDDLGTEAIGATSFFPARIGDLIATRYAELLPTVITTNLHRADFVARYGGARLDDRLHDGGLFVAVVGGSLRKKGRGQ